MVRQEGPALKLSVIIANYNHRNFVGAAIESALAVDWPHQEVIVVDDASTDDSRDVIDGFRGRVTAYFRPKSFQLGAHIFGFEKSTGDVIIFLDADDLLEPNVMREVAKVWRPGVSQVQYRMNLIDAAGTQFGTAIPQFPRKEDPAKLRRIYWRTMARTTPPGSGSAYSREFVRTVFAMAPILNAHITRGTRPIEPGEEAWLRASDAPLHTLSPILGDVVTIRKPLARYRIHSATTALSTELDPVKLRNRLRQDALMARLFATALQKTELPAIRDPLNRNFSHLQYRFGSLLIEPTAHPFPRDTVIGLACRLVYAAITFPQMPLRDRTLLLVWVIACALTPSYYRRNLVRWRFVGRSRPAVVRALLSVLSSLRSTRLPDRAGEEIASN
jgi:glycosyltransferase involved in cell wall biosynthesis